MSNCDSSGCNAPLQGAQDVLVMGSIVWHFSRESEVRLRQWLVEELVNVFENSAGIIKNEPGRRVAVANGLVIKERTAQDGILQILKFGLRRSGSYQAFKLARQLIACSILTPQPVAWATVRCSGLRVRDFIITEELKNSVSLPEKLTAVVNDHKEKGRLIDLLGQLLAAFHVNGFSNRDLKGGNVLVTEDGEMKLWIVDMDGVCRKHVVTRRRAARDFIPVLRELKIHAQPSESDMLRLVDAYNAVVPARLKLSKLPAV